MVKKISKKFIKGAGSVMNISPKKNYPIRSYKPGQDSSDRLKRDWINVGKSISKIIASQTNG